MTSNCPTCGASWENNPSCQEIFDEFLALEFSNLAYGKVHMLTVACFMIQHQRYSDKALVWIQRNLCAVLENGTSPSDIRHQMTSDVEQGKRTWKIERQPDEPALPHIEWSITIADIYAHKDDPADYCAWVEKWARTTLKELSI